MRALTIARLVGSLLVIAACGSHPQPAPAPAPAPANAPPPEEAAAPGHAAAAAPAPIVWSLECVPSTVTMAQRASVMYTIHATNTTSAVRDPERDPLDFTIDGVSSMQLAMAFGNGGREAAWDAIPPGK